MSIFLDKLQPPPPGSYVLDMGTGRGVFAQLLKTLLPSSAIVQADIKQFQPVTDHYFLSPIEQVSARPVAFSVIICAQVLHYIPHNQLDEVVTRLMNLVDQDGVMIIVEYDQQTSYSWLPYPIPKSWWKDFANRHPGIQLQHVIQDTDRRRPKYGVYLHHI